MGEGDVTESNFDYKLNMKILNFLKLHHVNEFISQINHHPFL